MAKENFVLLMGELISQPIFNKTRTQARFTIKTLRRNGKIDEPIITVFEDSVIPKLDNLQMGTYVAVKGILTTLDVKKSSVCTCCGAKNKSDGTLTTVVAIDVVDIGSNYELENIKEFSNNVIVIGTVANKPNFRQLPKSGINAMSYQIALNRKYHIKSQDIDQKSDYPWVSSFGEQAEEDNKRIQTGSQLLISGGLQTRVVYRKIQCANCNSEIQSQDIVAEIVPYSVEYLNNCLFTEGEEQK